VGGGGRGDHEVDVAGARVAVGGDSERDEGSVAAGGFPVEGDGGEGRLDVGESLGANHDLLGALGHRDALGELGEDDGGNGDLDGQPCRVEGGQVAEESAEVDRVPGIAGSALSISSPRGTLPGASAAPSSRAC
jgi:hypothetical protein